MLICTNFVAEWKFSWSSLFCMQASYCQFSCPFLQGCVILKICPGSEIQVSILIKLKLFVVM